MTRLLVALLALFPLVAHGAIFAPQEWTVSVSGTFEGSEVVTGPVYECANLAVVAEGVAAGSIWAVLEVNKNGVVGALIPGQIDSSTPYVNQEFVVPSAGFLVSTVSRTTQPFGAKLRFSCINASGAGGGGASTLNELTDVSTAGALSGDVLSFNGSTWEDTTLNIQLDTLTGAADGSFVSGVNGLSAIEWGDGELDFIESVVTSPGWVVGTKLRPNFNTNGVKANCPTATLGADPSKPWYTCPTTGLLKTKVGGLYMEMYNRTPNEAWPLQIDLYTAGDTDPNGIGLHIKASGGSHTAGDEGGNGIRLAMTPNWGNAFGTAAIPAGTGEVVVPLSGVSTEDSRYIGVGKPLVFSGSAAAFTRTPGAQPPSTVIVGSPKSGTAKADWTVTSTVNGTGIEAGNWCVSHDAYTIAATPGTGTASRYWLKISAIAGDGLSFSTQWWSQGVDQKYPDSHLWSLDPNSLSFAPCYTITSVGQDAVTKEVNGVTVYKTSTYSEAGAIGWDVVPYGEFKTTGVKVLMTADINPAGAGAAFTAQNELDFRGRHQIRKAFGVEGPTCATDDRSTSCLKDGTKGAFAYGLDIAEWGAETGVRYKYYQDGDLAAGGKFALIDPPTLDNDWGTPYVGIPVIAVDGVPAKSLIVSSDKGWGVGQQGFNLGHFAVVDGAVSHTDGNTLVWSDAEGAYVEAAPSGGATVLNDLTNVTSTAPVAGDFLTWSGSQWIDSKVLPSIDNHSDITITALAPDDILVYNSGTGQWENEDLQYTPYDYRQSVKLVGNDMDLKFGSWSIGASEWGKTFPVAATATATLPVLAAGDTSKFFKFMVKGGTSFSIKAPAAATSYSFNLVTTGANQDVITCDLTAEDADGTFMVEFWYGSANLGYVSCPGGVPVTVTSP